MWPGPVCGEWPRMKKRLSDMQRNIAEGLGMSPEQVHVKVSSMDGHDEIAQLQGIEARVLISLWEGL
jgi:2C-methyl-D-erythritol 2,4-cyclodiphosphate synthase